MSKAKAGPSSASTAEFPIPLVKEYTDNCERLKKYESAVIKRFAPKLDDILKEFIRLVHVFNNSYLPEYSALSYMGAARCEKIRERHIVELDFLMKAAQMFLKAYERRFELGYTDGDDAFRQGALRCYDDILSSPHLPKDSFTRAVVIRELKKIDPHTEQTSTFEAPFMRYEDLKRAAIVDMQDEHWQTALNKLTDISDDITERKTEDVHATVLEYAEITRLLLLLYLELPPAALAPSNAALLERYRYNPEVTASQRASESILDPELFLMFRGFVLGIQWENIKFMRDAYNDLGPVKFLSDEQHKLLSMSYHKFKEEFEIMEVQKACKTCPVFYDSDASTSSDEDDVKCEKCRGKTREEIKQMVNDEIESEKKKLEEEQMEDELEKLKLKSEDEGQSREDPIPMTESVQTKDVEEEGAVGGEV